MAALEQLTLDVEPPAPAPVEARCARCRGALSVNDRRYHRRYCGSCRAVLALEHAAETDWRDAPRPRRCECQRPFLIAEDGQARCVKCGRVAE